MDASGWFGARCVFAMSRGDDLGVYEERVTLWSAATEDDAIALAEAEAIEYADAVDAKYLGLVQAYAVADEPIAGAEVFSLMRTSPLAPSAYLDRHFDTGTERQRHQTDQLDR